MKLNIGVVITACLMGVTTHSVSGQGFIYKLTHPDAVGGSFVATHIDGVGETTAAGPGIEFFIKYNISPRFFATVGTGFFTGTDDVFKTNSVKSTLFPTFEAKACLNIMDSRSINPYVFLGVTAFGWESEVVVQNTTYQVGTYYDAGALIGGGVEITINDKWAFHASGDYRYIITSAADPKPKYWMAKAGLTYSIGEKQPKEREEMEYPLGEDELVLDDFFREEVSTAGERKWAEEPNEEDILDALFATVPESTSEEASSTGTPKRDLSTLSEVERLQLKIENLRTEVIDRTRRIDELETKVRENERTLADFTRKSAGEITKYSDSSFGVFSTEGFKENYQNGLQTFYNKKYRDTIRLFKSLLASNTDHRLASNCQYWIGESYHAIGEYRNAIDAFSSVMNYNRSYKFDDALIMNGICHMKLGNKLTARENFQELLSRFPDSEYTAKALRYLGRL